MFIIKPDGSPFPLFLSFTSDPQLWQFRWNHFGVRMSTLMLDTYGLTFVNDSRCDTLLAFFLNNLNLTISLMASLYTKGRISDTIYCGRTYRSIRALCNVKIDLASQITGNSFVHPTVYSSEHQWNHRRSALLAFVRVMKRCSMAFPRKWPVPWKSFSCHDAIIYMQCK